MKNLPLIFAFGVCLAVGHLAVVLGAPYLYMGVAIQRVSQKGAVLNHFVFNPRTTEASRQIVRPSPDLAYAACVYDLKAGPIRVRSQPWPSYMSISVFQANGDNIFVLNDRQAPQGVDFVLARAGQATPAGVRVVLSPTDRGIVLDRRLAPSPEAFAQADRARRQDTCARAG